MKLNGEDFFWVVSGSAYYPFWKISIVLVRVPFVVLKHYDQKQCGGREGLFGLYIWREAKLGTQNEQEPGGGAYAEVMEGCSLLLCLTCFLTVPKTTSPGGIITSVSKKMSCSSSTTQLT